MSLRGKNLVKLSAILLAVLAVAGIAAAAWRHGSLPQVTSIQEWWKKRAGSDHPGGAQGDNRLGAVRLVEGTTDTLELPPDVQKKLGVETRPVQPATAPRPLELVGSLGLDPDRLQRARTYFAGEVVDIGTVQAEGDQGLNTEARQLRVGDRVIKGQLLAVVFNADLGSKKNDLVDALSNLHLDQQQYDALNKLSQTAGATDAMLRSAQQKVETDLNSVRRAESTLRTWRVPEDEIKAIREDAERLFKEKGKRDPAKDKNWARVEVRAKLDGTVLERTATVGDIADPSADLFKIADLSELIVWVNAYEEDLPALHALKPNNRRWLVRVPTNPSAPPLRGSIDYVGSLIDPNQHTAPVRGRVKNANGDLHVGQFVTATLDLPAPDGQVEVPATALDEDGQQSIVFVQDPKHPNRFKQRHVLVARRGRREIYLRSDLSPQEKQKGLHTLKPGDPVVTAGVIELQAALEDLQAAAKQGKP